MAVAEIEPMGLAAALVLGVSMILGGAAVVWVARATASGRLGRNAWAGIRLPATRASDQAWSDAHRAAERPTVLGGSAGILSGVLLLVLGTRSGVGALIVIGVGLAGLLVGVLWGAAVGVRAATEAGAPTAEEVDGSAPP